MRRRWYRDSFAPPKSKYGRRDVPLSPGTAQALWPLVAGRSSEAFLFTSSTGGMIDQSNLAARVLKPAGRRAGVPWCSFHTFRHTAASVFFRAGWNAKQVQLVLGHHSPAFTLSTYVHLIADDLPDAAFLDDGATGGQQEGNQTSRNEPKETSAERPGFTVIAGETPDVPRQAEYPESVAARSTCRLRSVRIVEPRR